MDTQESSTNELSEKEKSNVFKSTKKKQKIKGIGYERISWLRLSAIF